MTAIRENPVRRISMPPIYTQAVRYVDMPWPGPPELPYVLYRIVSPHYNNFIKVRRILLDNFGEERAVSFTVWGQVLTERGVELEALFEKHGRHEVRKRFVDSIQYEKVF